MVKNIFLSTLYPGASEILVPINTSEIDEILFCPDKIEQRFGGNSAFQAFWNTKKWENNPSLVFTYTDEDTVYGQSYCQKTGHDHQITCVIAKASLNNRLVEKPGVSDPQNREKRGLIKRLCLYIDFQERETILFPLEAENIQSITFNEKQILKKIQNDAHLLELWETGDWINNPCILIEHGSKLKLYGRRTNDASSVSSPLK
ncbi:MAG: hypothetical protein AB8C84_13415 [Oligoflexales bacterium]